MRKPARRVLTGTNIFSETAKAFSGQGGLHMKTRGWGLWAVIICGVTLLSAGNLVADEQEPPEEITLDSDVYKTNRRGPVLFSHLNHAEDYGITCDECHHDYKDGKNIWEEGDPVKKCAACHDPNKNKGNVKKLSIAFHRNCKTCHRDLYRSGDSEDAPFRKCSDCHQRKS